MSISAKTPAPKTPEQQAAATAALQAEFQAKLDALSAPAAPPVPASQMLEQTHTDLSALRDDLHRRLQQPNALQSILEQIIDAQLVVLSAQDEQAGNAATPVESAA
jgi:hypothetical protein